MAARYWVGGQGTWDAASSPHWAASSGGAAGASVPTASDDAIFDANSGFGTTGAAVVNVNTPACNSLTVSGILNPGFTLQFVAGLTIGGVFSVVGPSQQHRPLILSNLPGTLRTLTCNGSHGTHTDVDFRDMQVAGSAGPLTGTRIGDNGGNGAGITFTPAAPQTWQGPLGGNWSDPAKWTSRVPLPQDDVNLGVPMNAGQTITLDCPRVGRDLSFNGITNTPTVVFGGSGNFAVNGSVDFRGVTFATNTSWALNGRRNCTIHNGPGTVATVNGWRLTVVAPGGKYTLLSHHRNGSGTGSQAMQVTYGAFDANGFDVGTFNFGTGNNTGIILWLGAGTWTLSGTSGIWNMGTNTTIYSGSETITITDASATGKTFAAANNLNKYGTLVSTAGGAGALTLTGNPTFKVLNVGAPVARNLVIGSKTQVSVENTLTLSGTLSVVSSSPGNWVRIGTQKGRTVRSIAGGVTFSADVGFVDRRTAPASVYQDPVCV